MPSLHDRPRQTDRLVARVTSEDKELLTRAAALEGSSVAKFLIAHVRVAAEEVIRRHESIQLNKEESLRFINALLEPPRAPTPRAEKALRTYRETVTEN